MGEFEAPVFIIAAPRSGSTLLYESLVKHPDFVSVKGESHALIEGIPELSIVAKQFASNQLDADDASSSVTEQLHARFLAACRTHNNQALSLANAPFRFLEKTPKNALRINFISAMYPDAKFVYLVREPVANISSIMDAWKSGKFVTYPQLPGWHGDWSLLLPPDWQSQRNKPLASVATFQWAQTHISAIEALNKLPKERVHVVSYEHFVQSPVNQCNRIFEFAGLSHFSVTHSDGPNLTHVTSSTLPLSRYTLTPPDKTKWHKHAIEISQYLDVIHDSLKRLNQFIGSRDDIRLDIVENFKHIVSKQSALRAQPAESTLPSPQRRPPISRNAPCHCGSGKRFKHCHGKPQ